MCLMKRSLLSVEQPSSGTFPSITRLKTGPFALKQILTRHRTAKLLVNCTTKSSLVEPALTLLTPVFLRGLPLQTSRGEEPMLGLRQAKPTFGLHT